MKKNNFDKLIDCVDDMLADLFYYDRKEDDDFTVKDAEEPLTEEQKDEFCKKIRSLI